MLKATAAPGDKKPIVITFTAPPQLASGPKLWKQLHLSGTLKGGVPPPKNPAGSKVSLKVHCSFDPNLVEGS